MIQTLLAMLKKVKKKIMMRVRRLWSSLSAEEVGEEVARNLLPMSMHHSRSKHLAKYLT